MTPRPVHKNTSTYIKYRTRSIHREDKISSGPGEVCKRGIQCKGDITADKFSRTMAVYTKARLYGLVLWVATLNLLPEGRSTNSGWRGWSTQSSPLLTSPLTGPISSRQQQNPAAHSLGEKNRNSLLVQEKFRDQPERERGRKREGGSERESKRIKKPGRRTFSGRGQFQPRGGSWSWDKRGPGSTTVSGYCGELTRTQSTLSSSGRGRSHWGKVGVAIWVVPGAQGAKQIQVAWHRQPACTVINSPAIKDLELVPVFRVERLITTRHLDRQKPSACIPSRVLFWWSTGDCLGGGGLQFKVLSVHRRGHDLYHSPGKAHDTQIPCDLWKKICCFTSSMSVESKGRTGSENAHFCLLRACLSKNEHG